MEIIKLKCMVIYVFEAKIQSKDKVNCRKMIELSHDVRDRFDVRDHVRVVLKKSEEPKQNFYANVQSKNKNDGRKVIELPLSIRDKFKIQDSVKVTIELLV